MFVLLLLVIVCYVHFIIRDMLEEMEKETEKEQPRNQLKEMSDETLRSYNW